MLLHLLIDSAREVFARWCISSVGKLKSYTISSRFSVKSSFALLDFWVRREDFASDGTWLVGGCTHVNVLYTAENCDFSILYCIVSIHLYSVSCSAHQSEALPVREKRPVIWAFQLWLQMLNQLFWLNSENTQANARVKLSRKNNIIA